MSAPVFEHGDRVQFMVYNSVEWHDAVFIGMSHVKDNHYVVEATHSAWGVVTVNQYQIREHPVGVKNVVLDKWLSKNDGRKLWRRTFLDFVIEGWEVQGKTIIFQRFRGD